MVYKNISFLTLLIHLIKINLISYYALTFKYIHNEKYSNYDETFNYN